MIRHYRVALLVGFMTAVGLQAQERVAAPPTPVPTGPAAVVNGQEIPEIAVQRALKAVPPEKHADARQEITNFLIDNVLIEQYLSSKVQVLQAEVDARLLDLRTQLAKQKLDFAAVLRDMMLTENELASHVRAEIRWEKFVDSQVNEAALRQLFAQEREMFDGTVVRARHLLLSAGNTPQTADAARQELLGIKKDVEGQAARGLAKLPLNTDNLTREKERARLTEEAFIAYAKQKSTCPSKADGGDVSWFPRFGGMVEPFAAAAFALKPYQISEVVQTQFGLHLILVVDRKPGKADLKFEEVQEGVKEVFAYRLREKLAKELRQQAKIQVR